mgnify:CR=1 FL=1
MLDKEAELTNKGKQTLSDFASGYLYFGLHRTAKGWTFREWAPNASHIYIVGTFNNWEEKATYKLKKLKNGIWEINLPEGAIHHGDLYKLNVYWDGGQGERIPIKLGLCFYFYNYFFHSVRGNTRSVSVLREEDSKHSRFHGNISFS